MDNLTQQFEKLGALAISWSTLTMLGWKKVDAGWNSTTMFSQEMQWLKPAVRKRKYKWIIPVILNCEERKSLLAARQMYAMQSAIGLTHNSD